MMTSLKKTGVYALLIMLCLLAVGPFLWLLSTALKSSDENIFSAIPQLLPQTPTLDNFAEVLKKIPMLRYVANSMIVTGLTVVLNLVFSVLAAYPLARMRFFGQKAVILTVLATMMIPFQVIMVPLYLIVLKMGLVDSNPDLFGPVANGWLGLVLPFAISGFGIFFVQQALVSLPKELEECAMLDGCNSFQILTRVLLPLIGPTLATLAVFTFMSAWGEFLWPSIVQSEPDQFLLPLGLIQLQGTFSANWRLIAAGTILSMLPILAFFLLLQRYFVSGNLGGSVKG